MVILKVLFFWALVVCGFGIVFLVALLGFWGADRRRARRQQRARQAVTRLDRLIADVEATHAPVGSPTGERVDP